MSHTTAIEFQVKNWNVLVETCNVLGCPITIGDQQLQLWGRNIHNVHAVVKLPDWKMPVGISKDGLLFYDHFGTSVNARRHLVKLRREYTLRTAEVVAKRKRKRTKRHSKTTRPGWKMVEVFV